MKTISNFNVLSYFCLQYEPHFTQTPQETETSL